MKIAEINGAHIHVFAACKTLLIIERDAVFIRCLACGEMKSVHMLVESEKSLPWMRQCTCGTSNAPHDGGDNSTQPLSDPLAVTSFHAQLVNPFGVRHEYHDGKV